MIGVIGKAFLLAALIGGTDAQERVAVERIIVQHTNADRIVTDVRRAVDLPSRKIAELAADARTNCILVSGTREAIDEVRELVRLLDVSPSKLDLHVRLFRILRDGDRVKNTVIADAKMSTRNNRKVTVSGADPYWDTEVIVLPRVNGDGSVSVSCEFTLGIEGRVRSNFRPAARRVKSGERLAITYLRGDADETLLAHELSEGQKSAREAYRLEVTSTLRKP